jgi:hypothetical protein
MSDKQTKESIIPAPVAAAPVAPKAEKPKSLAERVKAKLEAESQSFKPTLLEGKAGMFDLKLYGQDYTAGGLLEARFVENRDERLSIVNAKGFRAPSHYDPELKDITQGGLKLMLRPKVHGDIERRHLDKINREQLASANPAYNAIAQEAREKTGAIIEQVEAPTRKEEIIRPA